MSWHSVTRNTLCPICGKPDWCGRSDDGANRCMRIADAPAGWRKLKTNSDGGTVFRPVDESRNNCEVRRSKPKSRKSTTFHTLENAIDVTARMIGGNHVDTWTYHYADGSEALYVARFNMPDGSKQFRPFHKIENGYLLGDPPDNKPLPLYRLADVSNHSCVYLVEGEKCADAAISIGLATTTSAHGSKSAAKTDWRQLADREVVILPDADEAGQHYAETIASILHRLHPPAQVRILHLPDLTDGGDIVDFIEERRIDAKDNAAICREIVDLAALVPEYVPPIGRDTDSPSPVIVYLAEVKPEPVRWLWPGRIAMGKVTMIVGDPGLGKSFITLDIASRVSTGSTWPDAQSETNPAGGVVLLNAEDDVADTIRPRLDAAGADVSRIIALSAVQQKNESARLFNLATDLVALEQTIHKCEGCRLVVIDPITAYLGKTDSHKNAEIRGLLAPLAELASRYNVAFVVVSHMNKNTGGPAIYRTMGSLAFIAAVRAAWAVTKDKEDPKRRLVLPLKNNLATDIGGLAYCLVPGTHGIPYVSWDPDPVNINVDEALSGDCDVETKSELKAASDWLYEELSSGPMPAKDVKREARENSIAEKTLKRAKKDIGAEAKRQGFGEGGIWYWALPGTWFDHSGPSDAIEGQPHDVAPYEESGPLCNKQTSTGNIDSSKYSEMDTIQ